MTLCEIKDLDTTKASPFGSIPLRILTEHFDLFDSMVQHFVNETIGYNRFQDELKKGDITLLFKKGDTFVILSYRPITILPAISKISKRIFLSQVLHYMENFMSPYLCTYRTGYNTQHAFLRFIERCRYFLDMKGLVGAVFMDLAKAFECLDH